MLPLLNFQPAYTLQTYFKPYATDEKSHDALLITYTIVRGYVGVREKTWEGFDCTGTRYIVPIITCCVRT
jgi:hypothetical protein